MAIRTPVGRRLAVMVADAGLPEELINEILGPRGFAPIVIVPTLADLAVRMRLLPPALVVVPVSGAARNAEFSQFEQELRRNARTAAIGTAPVKDADTVLAAMRAGVLEFLVTPATDDEIKSVIARVLSLSIENKATGPLYTIYSGKGGLGTSTIAASLAWELAHRTGAPGAALVDFTTTGAGMRVMLNLNPSYDLGNISARKDRLDAEFLQSVMVRHSDGVAVLAAAEEVDAVEPLDAPTAGRLFEVVRHEYAYTVVDTDHHFADQTIAALDAADRIVLVTTLDVSALRSTQRTLGVFARLGYAAEKLVIVANRRSDRDRISLSDAEHVLGRPIAVRLPNDYASCADAITNGDFVQRFAPTSPLVAAVSTLATLLAGEKPGKNGSNGREDRSRLSRLFSRR